MSASGSQAERLLSSPDHDGLMFVERCDFVHLVWGQELAASSLVDVDVAL